MVHFSFNMLICSVYNLILVLFYVCCIVSFVNAQDLYPQHMYQWYQCLASLFSLTTFSSLDTYDPVSSAKCLMTSGHCVFDVVSDPFRRRL